MLSTVAMGNFSINSMIDAKHLSAKSHPTFGCGPVLLQCLEEDAPEGLADGHSGLGLAVRFRTLPDIHLDCESRRPSATECETLLRGRRLGRPAGILDIASPTASGYSVVSAP